MRRWQGAALAILLAALLAALGAAGQVTRTVESVSGVAYEQKIELVTDVVCLEQDFVPQYGRLDAVRIHMDAIGCAGDGGALQVSILNENGGQVFSTELSVAGLPQYGWVEIPVHVRLAPGRVSTLVLKCVGSADKGPEISFLDAGLAAAAEQQGLDMVYAGIRMENAVLQAAFIYAVPIGLHEFLAYYIFGLFLIALVIL